MVIDEVNIDSLAVLKPKDDPPVRTHSDSPKTCEIAFQQVKPERQIVKIGNFLSRVHKSQNLPDLAHVLRVELV